MPVIWSCFATTVNDYKYINMRGCCKPYSKVLHEGLNVKKVKTILEFASVISVKNNEFTDICPSIYSTTFKINFLRMLPSIKWPNASPWSPKTSRKWYDFRDLQKSASRISCILCILSNNGGSISRDLIFIRFHHKRFLWEICSYLQNFLYKHIRLGYFRAS